MTLIRLSVFFILMVVRFTQPAEGLAVPEAELSTLLEDIPDSSLVPLQRHARSVDMFGVKRAILQGLVADMQKLADDGQKAVDEYTKTLDSRTSRFLIDSNNTLVNFLKQIRDQIYNAVNSGQDTMSNVIQCFYQQEEAADKLVTDVMEHVGQCVSNVARDISYFLQGIVYFVRDVISSIGYTAANIVNCGIATFENFLQVGSCLTSLISNAQWELFYFVSRFAGGVTQAVGAVATIPINLAFCSTQNLPEGVRRVAEILNNLGQCAINATG